MHDKCFRSRLLIGEIQPKGSALLASHRAKHLENGWLEYVCFLFWGVYGLFTGALKLLSFEGGYMLIARSCRNIYYPGLLYMDDHGCGFA